MTPVLVSVDKAGDLKIGSKKCRLHKKAEVVKVAKKYGIITFPSPNCTPKLLRSAPLLRSALKRRLSTGRLRPTL
jgi:hypothetical protein